MSDLNNMEDKETTGLKTIIVEYIRHWKLFIVVFICSIILAIFYLMMVPRTFQMEARVQLQDNNSNGGNSLGLGEAAGLMKSFGLGGGGSAGSLNIDDERVILTSNELMREVVSTLGMNVEYKKPGSLFHKMYTNSPLLLSADQGTFENVNDNIKLRVSITETGAVDVKVTSKEDGKKYQFSFTSLPAEMRLEQGVFTLSSRRGEELSKPYKMKILVNPVSWAAEDLIRKLLIDDYSKSSNTLELMITDHERRRGIDVLNTLIQKYNEQDERTKKSEMTKSLTYLSERLNVVDTDLRNTEIEIEKFKTLHNMTDIESDIQLYIGQMQEINTKMINLEMEWQMMNIMEEYVKNPANEYSFVSMLLSGKDGETSSTAITMYNEKLLERLQLMQSSYDKNPLILSVDEEIKELRGTVFSSISNSKNSLKQSIEELKKMENVVLNKMGDIPMVERQYINFRRQQEIQQGIYLLLIQKREDLSISMNDMKDRSRMVEPSYVKKKSVAPRKLYAALGIMFITLLVPVLLIEGKKLYMSLKEEYKKGV